MTLRKWNIIPIFRDKSEGLKLEQNIYFVLFTQDTNHQMSGISPKYFIQQNKPHEYLYRTLTEYIVNI